MWIDESELLELINKPISDSWIFWIVFFLSSLPNISTEVPSSSSLTSLFNLSISFWEPPIIFNLYFSKRFLFLKDLIIKLIPLSLLKRLMFPEKIIWFFIFSIFFLNKSSSNPLWSTSKFLLFFSSRLKVFGSWLSVSYTHLRAHET